MHVPTYNTILLDTHSRAPIKIGCRHDVLSNGVQLLTLGEPSQNTVTEWVRSMDTVVRQVASGRSLRVLTDARRSLLPPLAYVAYIAELMMLHPYRVGGGRHAFLHAAGPLTPPAQAITHSLLGGGAQVCFFASHQHAEALRWLAA